MQLNPAAENINKNRKNYSINNVDSATNFVFFVFCLWAFVVLARPQDLFPVLGQIRPALVMTAITLGFVILRLKDLPGPSLFQERQVKYFIALFIIMVFGIPFASHVGLAFNIIFAGYIAVLIFFLIFYKIIDSIDRLYKVLLIACLGSGLYSAFALAQHTPGMGRLRFGGMFDPNDLAFFLLGFLPLNLIYISRDNPLWIRVACFSSFSMGLLVILQSGSRAGFVSLVVVLALLLLRKSMTVRPLLKAVSVAMLMAIITLTPVDTERYSTILAYEEDYNVQEEGGRVNLWKFGIRTMFENPVTGVGVGSYGRVLGLDRQAREAETRAWQAPHNSVVQIGAETGVIGFALFLLLSLNVLRILNRARKRASQYKLIKIGEMGIIGFVGLFIAGLFLSHAYTFYYAFYFAISAVVSQLLLKEQSFNNTLDLNKSA